MASSSGIEPLTYLSELIQDLTLKGVLSTQITPDLVEGNPQLEPLCTDRVLFENLQKVLDGMEIDISSNLSKGHRKATLLLCWDITCREKREATGETSPANVNGMNNEGSKVDQPVRKKQAVEEFYHQKKEHKEPQSNLLQNTQPSSSTRASAKAVLRGQKGDLAQSRSDDKESLHDEPDRDEDAEDAESFSDTDDRPHESERKRTRPRPVPHKISPSHFLPPNTLREVLEGVTVQHVALENWTRKRLVLVGSGQTLERALSRINAHNIQSIPVVDDTTKEVIGMIGIEDVIAAMHEMMDAGPVKARVELMTKTIAEILHREGRTPTYLISTHASLYQAIQAFSTYNLHRIMIVDRDFETPSETFPHIQIQEKPEASVIGVLTQSDILRFLAQNLMWMKYTPTFSKTLYQLGFGGPDIGIELANFSRLNIPIAEDIPVHMPYGGFYPVAHPIAPYGTTYPPPYGMFRYNVPYGAPGYGLAYPGPVYHPYPSFSMPPSTAFYPPSYGGGPISYIPPHPGYGMYGAYSAPATYGYNGDERNRGTPTDVVLEEGGYVVYEMGEVYNYEGYEEEDAEEAKATVSGAEAPDEKEVEKESPQYNEGYAQSQTVDTEPVVRTEKSNEVETEEVKTERTEAEAETDVKAPEESKEARQEVVAEETPKTDEIEQEQTETSPEKEEHSEKQENVDQESKPIEEQAKSLEEKPEPKLVDHEEKEPPTETEGTEKQELSPRDTQESTSPSEKQESASPREKQESASPREKQEPTSPREKQNTLEFTPEESSSLHEDIATRSYRATCPLVMEQSQPVWQAFDLLNETQRDGLAVVDMAGRLVGTLNSSHIKSITRRNFSVLSRPILEYIQRDRHYGWWTLPISAAAQDTLERLVLQFVATGTHRVFMTRPDGTPASEIRILDVLRVMLEEL